MRYSRKTLSILAPWIIYFPIGLKYGNWTIHLQAWLLIELYIAAVLIRGRRRVVSDRLNRTKMLIPEMIYERIIVWIAVMGLMLVTTAVAIKYDCSCELSLMCRSMLYSVPLFFVDQVFLE